MPTDTQRKTRGSVPSSGVSGYVQPGRVGKKPLVGHFNLEAHKAIKRLALDVDRSVEELMGEAFRDLLQKLGRGQDARLFEK